MTYINQYCVDAGTENCPCPLAETGDCLICGRLAGKGQCDCMWAGLCIYNEYIQNGGVVRNPRHDTQVKISKKTWYGDDLLALELDSSRGMALNAARPGSFVFLRAEEKGPFTDTPVSVMASDMKKGKLHLALKIISGKTKRIAEAQDSLMLRGIYRNGLLGDGLAGLAEDVKRWERRQDSGVHRKAPGRKKWLIMTKGVGFAPAINLLRWADDRVDTQMVIDTEKIREDMVSDCLRQYTDMGSAAIKIAMDSLQNAEKYAAEDFDRVIILASDYYIRTMAEKMDIPSHKLVFSNNFHMCCGEGVCGACGHTDAGGNFSKMCKCRRFDVKELLRGQ